MAGKGTEELVSLFSDEIPDELRQELKDALDSGLGRGPGVAAVLEKIRAYTGTLVPGGRSDNESIAEHERELVERWFATPGSCATRTNVF